MDTKQEALIALLKEEPYAYSEDRPLNKRKLQLRYVRLMPETHQRYWRLRVHKWFIDNCRKKDSPRVFAIMRSAVSQMYEGHKGKPLSTRRVNKLVKRIYKELAKIRGKNRLYNPIRRMDDFLGMYLNIVTLEKTCLSEIMGISDNVEYDIRLHQIDWKCTQEKTTLMINRYSGLCNGIAGIIASYI